MYGTQGSINGTFGLLLVFPAMLQVLTSPQHVSHHSESSDSLESINHWQLRGSISMDDNLKSLHGERTTRVVPTDQLPRELLNWSAVVQKTWRKRAAKEESRTRTDWYGFYSTRKKLTPSCAGWTSHTQSRQMPKAFQESGRATCKVSEVQQDLQEQSTSQEKCWLHWSRRDGALGAFLATYSLLFNHLTMRVVALSQQKTCCTTWCLWKLWRPDARKRAMKEGLGCKRMCCSASQPWKHKEEIARGRHYKPFPFHEL